MSTISSLVTEYRAARGRAYEAILEAFPSGETVRISRANSSPIYGVVHHVSVSTPDQVACLLGNGNIWDYPVESLAVLKKSKLRA